MSPGPASQALADLRLYLYRPSPWQVCEPLSLIVHPLRLEVVYRVMYFAIPLVSEAAATDWRLTTLLLNRTLTSVSNSSDSRYEIIIACHDIPEVRGTFKDKLRFLQLTTPTPSSLAERCADRTRKRIRVMQHVRERNPGYTMLLDADDLIDKDLVQYVHTRSATNGYIVKRGYKLDVASKTLWSVDDFDQVCGSSAIFRFGRDDLPRDDSDEHCYFRQLKSHRLWEATAIRHERPLEAINYPAVIYVSNSRGNITALRQSDAKRRVLSSARRLRNIAKRRSQRRLGRVEIDEQLSQRFQLHGYL